MKTVGVLGGLGPQATMDFERRLHQVAQRMLPQAANSGYPTMIVHYCRHAPLLFNPDRTPVQPLQPDPRLLDAAKNLGMLVDFIVIPSNTPHLFQSEIELASGRKVLSMIDLTLDHIAQRHSRKIGVLGFGNPIIYTNRLQELDVEYYLIEGDLQAALDKAILQVMEGKDNAESSQTAKDAIAELRSKKPDAIILGCTEIPLLLHDSTLAPDLVNPAQLLAEGVIRLAIS